MTLTNYTISNQYIPVIPNEKYQWYTKYSQGSLYLCYTRCTQKLMILRN